MWPKHIGLGAMARTEAGDHTAGQRWDLHSALRRRRQAERLWRLGPRVLCELVEELRRHHPAIASDIDRRLARFAALDPQILAAVGGDRFPAPPLHAIGGKR